MTETPLARTRTSADEAGAGRADAAALLSHESTADGTDVGATRVIPSALCFWGVLQESASPGDRTFGKRRRERLGYLFETLLPMSIENVHAVYVNAQSGGRRVVLACGMDRELVQRNVSSGVVALCPSEIPAELDVVGVSPSRLNLLVGEFEPMRIRRERLRLRYLGAALAVMCVFVAMAGLERRTGKAKELEAAALQSMDNIYASVLGEHGGAQPDSLRLLAALRELRISRQTLPNQSIEPDAADSLQRLLQAWPKEESLRIQVESITVTGESLVVRALAPDHASAQKLESGLAAGAGFVLQPPQITSLRDSVRLDLRLSRKGDKTR